MSRNKTLAIAGGGAFSRLIVDLALDTGEYNSFRVYDDFATIDGVNMFGKIKDIDTDLSNNAVDAVAIGIGYRHFDLRERLYLHYRQTNRLATLIHPTAFISSRAKIGQGCMIFSHVNIEAWAELADNVVVFNKSSVTHDVKIGEHTFLSVGVSMGGRTTIGRNVFIGVNATLINDISVGDNSTVAAGTLVSKDIPASSCVIGNPFKIVNNLKF